MATTIYESGYIGLIDGTKVYVTPLKIKYLREFMESFNNLKKSVDEDESLTHMLECGRIAFKQYMPSIMTIFDVEDNVDMDTLHSLLDFAAGLKKVKTEDATKPAESEKDAWESLDLAELESEVFLLGKWKDYEDLEASLSLPELIATLNAKRDTEQAHRKFLAAMQGIDLDKQSGKSNNKWEEMKAKAFSKGKATDPNDITSLQGYNAQKAGFGIGMGLGYERIG